MFLPEGTLQEGVQAFRRAEELDGNDTASPRLYGKHQAGAHRLAIEVDHTGAADTIATGAARRDVEYRRRWVLLDALDSR